MRIHTYVTYMCRSVILHHLPCLRWPLLLTSLYTDLLAYELLGFFSNLTVGALRSQVPYCTLLLLGFREFELSSSCFHSVIVST